MNYALSVRANTRRLW